MDQLTLRIVQIRNLGGKLGEAMAAEYKANTVGDMLYVPIPARSDVNTDPFYHLAVLCHWRKCRRNLVKKAFGYMTFCAG